MRRLSIKIKMEVFAPTHWWTPHVLKKDAAKSALLDAPIDKTWYSCYLRMEAILIRFLWQSPSSEEDFLLLEVRQPAAFTSRWGQMFFLGWREAVRLWNLHESKKKWKQKDTNGCITGTHDPGLPRVSIKFDFFLEATLRYSKHLVWACSQHHGRQQTLESTPCWHRSDGDPSCLWGLHTEEELILLINKPGT